jgi:putative SOS response-associated peptidase YedK
MPGRYFLTTPLADVAAKFDAIPDAPGPGPRRDAAPGEAVAAITGKHDGRRVVEMRWGMIPMGRVNARKRPVMETIINARSETLFKKTAFADVNRAILPVNGWYEWTGKTRRKTRWEISAPKSPILAFEAIWDVWKSPSGTEIASLATVKVDPSADVAPTHHRMAAILDPADWAVWLGEAEGDPEACLRTYPDNRLNVIEAAADLQ